MNPCFLAKEQIISLIKKAIANSGLETDDDARQIYLELPESSQHGDLSTNIAMRMYKTAKSKLPGLGRPSDLANMLVSGIWDILKESSIKTKIRNIEVKEPGFINFFLSDELLFDTLKEIVCNSKDYGRLNIGKKMRVNIEFVSANPTGPLTIAHARQAAFGDSLANILEFAGFTVAREYYLNDEGNQILNLGKSIQARHLTLHGLDAVFPEDGYKGDYIADIAKEIKARYGKKYVDSNEKSLNFFCRFGVRYILAMIKNDLRLFGVRFDKWTSQRLLHKSGKIEKVLSILEKKGCTYKKEGAVWFRSTKLGDDKDRVLIKQDGTSTYLTPDIAYHKDKYSRRFKRLIDIWGPDHHGYTLRLKAAVKALGYSEESLSVLIVQLSTLYRDGVSIPMSTREGEFVTLREVMDEAGKDAARFFFLMRDSYSHLDFDLQLAKRESPENPVYYIQYAHARICSILEYAKTTVQEFSKTPNLHLLKEPEEIELIRALRKFPYTVELCSKKLEPHILTFYLRELAARFHYFYTKHRVVSDDDKLNCARLILISCVRIVLENGLKLLGVSAPEKM